MALLEILAAAAATTHGDHRFSCPTHEESGTAPGRSNEPVEGLDFVRGSAERRGEHPCQERSRASLGVLDHHPAGNGAGTTGRGFVPVWLSPRDSSSYLPALSKPSYRTWYQRLVKQKFRFSSNRDRLSAAGLRQARAQPASFTPLCKVSTRLYDTDCGGMKPVRGPRVTF